MGLKLYAQNLFEVPAYELAIEEIRHQATTWNLSPKRVKDVLELDVTAIYGKSSSKQRKAQQTQELQKLSVQYLKQYYYLDQRPRAHVYDEADQYRHDQHGITIGHKGLNFIVIPTMEVDIVEGLLTTQVQSLVELTPKFDAFESRREDHLVMLLFKLRPDALTLYYQNQELRIRDVRVMIYNKYSEEIVYDHYFSTP